MSDYKLTMNQELLLELGIKPRFDIGDYVRLGKDMPYKIRSTNQLIECHKFGYRLATIEEIEVAKLNFDYKMKKGNVIWDDVLKAYHNLK
jgi:hypothetical protein